MQTKVNKLVFVLCFLLIAMAARGAVSDYIFTQSEDDYVEITGGAVLINSVTPNPYQNNPVFEAIPLGFNFIFDGIIYDTVSIAENGFLAMGNTVVTSNRPGRIRRFGSLGCGDDYGDRHSADSRSLHRALQRHRGSRGHKQVLLPGLYGGSELHSSGCCQIQPPDVLSHCRLQGLSGGSECPRAIG